MARKDIRKISCFKNPKVGERNRNDQKESI